MSLRDLLVEVRRAQAANDHDYERLRKARIELDAAERAENESATALQVARMNAETEKAKQLREKAE